MKIHQEAHKQLIEYETRRHFLKQCTTGIGMMAMGSFLNSCGINNVSADALATAQNPLSPKNSPLLGKAKAVIYIHTAGAPSQLEMFDYKPELQKMDGLPCPKMIVDKANHPFFEVLAYNQTFPIAMEHPPCEYKSRILPYLKMVNS